MSLKIYTKTGDLGKTSLIGGTKVPKSHLRIETYGTVDELNSYIGLVGDLIEDIPSKIILKEIQMTYHYQAKMNAYSTFKLPQGEVFAIREELKNNDASFRRYTVEVYDEVRNHICTGNIYWQIKPWNKTKTTN